MSLSEGEDRLQDFKRWVQGRVSPERRVALRPFLVEPLAFLFRRDLAKLAILSGTDKWGEHWYTAHYARHFAHLRQRPITLLEIGVGGYDKPEHGGGSLRMWRRYFPKGKIVGLDYYDKTRHAEKRIRIYQGDQSDETLLRRIVAEVGRPDIVIDDGSHQNHHVIKSFEVLFPLLAEDGIYVIEDTQTAYWPDFGGSSDDLLTAPTSMCLLKRLADGLNYQEFRQPGYVPSYFDRHITGLHFYHNLVFVQKGNNTEGSNLVRNNNKPN
jgi:voltage-gated potassium channel Kch